MKVKIKSDKSFMVPKPDIMRALRAIGYPEVKGRPCLSYYWDTSNEKADGYLQVSWTEEE